MSNADEDAFRARREDMKARIEPLDRDAGATVEDRKAFFDAVYDMADGDEAAVPWADLQPKPQLLAWLAANPGAGARAIDIACGLGDNAEALAAAGYATTAFDLSQKAVDWARRRFPQTSVDYRAANLMQPLPSSLPSFDVIFLRNVLIYFDTDAKAGILRRVMERLRPDGVLYTGHAESISNLQLPLRTVSTSVHVHA